MQKIYIFLILIADFCMSLRKSYDVSLVSWKSTGTSVFDFNARLLGRERRGNGTLHLKEDVGDDHFTEELQTYIDANGSGDYKLLPLSLPQQPVCQAIDAYWKYFEASLKYGVNTDCPFANRTCPLPKGHYYFKDITVKTDDWPLVMPRGYFKSVISFKKDGQVVSVIEVTCLIADRTI
ncbi:uncharacterized protein LOC128266140 [Drosophila gunungcola]|uniref:uncharacterized protein LOC128266140 n=1 Tax=Drosophila gunungcola TaxID=103775 RepID=UPI0022E70697|nr:uncharacterized protein LOC128266140 [Drosophila gunungcola]